MRYRMLTLVSAIALASCGGVVTTRSTQPTATAPTTSTVTVAASAAPCLDGTGEFFGDGPIGSRNEGSADAATVTALTLDEHEGCEHLVIELAATSGAPATSLGSTTAELVRRSGVVRIHLDPAVTATTLSDIAFDGALAGRVYVVRDFDGSLFIDVHLKEAAVARFSQVSNPVRLAVDLAPGGAPLQVPEVSDFVVVMPVPDRIGPMATVEGYGRTFEANVILRLRQSGEIVAEDFTTSSDYLETWGSFEIPVPPGIVGEVEVFVGEDSARDGEEQGVRLHVTIDG